MKIYQCTDGYPSCRNAEATGQFCEGHCKSEAFVRRRNEKLDEAIDAVLRAGGSALKHYTMPKMKGDMRSAMLEVIGKAKAGYFD